jgi:hypothetical protein
MGTHRKDNMETLEIVEIDDGLGIIFPSQTAEIFKDAKDGAVFLTETSNGFTLTTVDPNATPTSRNTSS